MEDLKDTVVSSVEVAVRSHFIGVAEVTRTDNLNIMIRIKEDEQKPARYFNLKISEML